MPQDRLFRRVFSGANGFLIVALSSAVIVLISSAVIGARDLSDDGRTAETVTDDRSGGTSDDALLDEGGIAGAPDSRSGSDGTSPESGAGGSGAQGGDVDGGDGSTSGSDGSTPGGEGPGEGGGPSVAGPLDEGPREGVHRSYIEWGVHAPITLNGQPLNIAEDFLVGLKGYLTQLNREKVNGRVIRLFLTDDEYTTGGGRESANTLVHEVKPFFIAGTLGVDQISIVADEAKKAGIPYMAGGGPEKEWRDKAMFQNASNYDQYMELLVRYICSRGKQLVGGNEVRIGTTTLDSPFILPVEERFVDKLVERGCIFSPVDPNARGTINKPDEQTTYRDQLVKLSNAYGGRGANLVVPLQDPVSTSRQVQELRTFPGYDPEWTFSNFVHDANTTLALMAGEWTGTRGLSGGCYYHEEGNPNAYNRELCAEMRTAHEQWVGLGHVEYGENTAGCTGTPCEYDYDEESWSSQDGQGGAAGYQAVHFWLKALREIGADPTRDKFVQALRNYDGYSDLLSAPITFRGSDNIMRGSMGAVIVEGRSNLRYRQVTELTPGIVDQF